MPVTNLAIFIKTTIDKEPKYQYELPEGNNGLGLLLLGASGEWFLTADVYKKIKFDTQKP